MCPICEGETLGAVRLAGRAADQGVHHAAHRPGRDSQPDQGRARRRSGARGSWPRRRGTGFDLLAWLLPIVGVLGGAAVLGVLAWRWTREREPEPAPQRWSLNGHPLGPDEERRLDEELARFDG